MSKLEEKSSAPKFRDEMAFRGFSLVVLLLLVIFCIVPFVLMLSVSLSSETSLGQYGYRFWPTEVSFAAYEYLWAKRLTIGRCYLLTIITTVVGTVGNLVLTSLFAYPLSRKDFKQRNIFAFIVFFTVMFNGGLTSTYIIWTRFFHIKNTIWALILPGGLMSAMNVLMVRNYYSANIPYSIIEAAGLDGASDMRVFTTIVIPLSKPVLATIGLFAAIGYWNNWTNGLYYITDTSLYTIQVYLKRLMDNIAYLKSSNNVVESAALALRSMPTESARMAIAIVAIIPILLVYPFIQKQLVKGMVVGGVKG
ncbi:MAG: carbohydrate ABC transporter permease [Lachnospiraceae bacterium]|nr:carbohydrate ABC transporter permease [Lachnospiraceae bacterium]